MSDDLMLLGLVFHLLVWDEALRHLYAGMRTDWEGNQYWGDLYEPPPSVAHRFVLAPTLCDWSDNLEAYELRWSYCAYAATLALAATTAFVAIVSRI